MEKIIKKLSSKIILIINILCKRKIFFNSSERRKVHHWALANYSVGFYLYLSECEYLTLS